MALGWGAGWEWDKESISDEDSPYPWSRLFPKREKKKPYFIREWLSEADPGLNQVHQPPQRCLARDLCALAWPLHAAQVRMGADQTAALSPPPPFPPSLPTPAAPTSLQSLISSGTTISQLFDQDKWENHRSMKRYFRELKLMPQSTVLRRIAKPCTSVAAVSRRRPAFS